MCYVEPVTYRVDGVRLRAHGEGDAREALREAFPMAVCIADGVHKHLSHIQGKTSAPT